MNEPVPAHPALHDLEAYLLGRLADERNDQISQHVADCSVCCETLEELADRSDGFLRKLQVASRSSSDSVTGAVIDFPLTSDENGDRRRIEGYELLDIIGRGGMGVVYRARQAGLNRLVALKMISAGVHAGPEEKVRFRKEAEAVARLTHPNIIQIHDIGTAEDAPWFTMELIEGANLKEAIAGVPWNSAAAARLVEILARAIQFAHEQDIIHRDLKPANVLLVEIDGFDDGQRDELLSRATPKITDFGLAKRLNQESDLTKTGMVAGTPGFMAPEQALGKEATIIPATDVYALGAILYNLITGRPPFLADTSIRVIQQVLNEEPVSPRTLNPSVAKDLETICLKCLEKEPARRYESAVELADDLGRFQRGEPIRARKIGTIGKVWRWSKRNRRFAAVSGVLLLLLIVAAIGGPLIALSYQQLAVSERESASAARSAGEKAEAARRVAKSEAERAEKERTVARRKAVVATEVSNFLLGLFDDADPLAFSGRAFGALPKVNPSALEIVDRGAETLADKSVLRDQPLVRATLLEKIGTVYLSLGRADKAGPVLNESLALRRRHLKPPHADLAAGLNNIGFLHFTAGDMDKAETWFKQALAMRIQVLGGEHPQTLETKVQLGIVHLVQTRPAEGEAQLNQALAVYRRRRGDRQRSTADSRRDTQWSFMALAALTYHSLQSKDVTGRLKAIPLVGRLQALARELPNENLGAIVVHFIEAEKLRYGGQVLAKLSKSAAAANARKAETEYLRAIRLAEKTGTADHYMLAWIRREYGYFLYEAGRYDEAELAFQRAITVFRGQFGESAAGHISHLLYQVARCIRNGRFTKAKTPAEQRKRWEEVARHSRESVELDRRRPNVNPAHRATHALFHGSHLLNARPPCYREAIAPLRTAWNIRRKRELKSRHPLPPAIMLLEALLGQKKNAEAERLIGEIREAVPNRRWGSQHFPSLVQSAERLAALGKPKPALWLLNEAVASGFRDARRLETSAPLRPLAGRADFQQLLKRMRAGTD